MKVVVLGAGVIGISTAYFLAVEGHEVVVVDRQPAVGRETSFANAGQIAVSHASSWATPGLPWQLFKWLGKDDAPFFFRFKADPQLWNWGWRFLLSCTNHQHKESTGRIRLLAQYSLACLIALRDTLDLNYQQSDRGILSIYRTRLAFEEASRKAETSSNKQMQLQIFDAAGCRVYEPALAHSQVDFAGGVLSKPDESGNAFIYTEALARVCKTLGVKFRFSSTINHLETRGSEVTAVHLKGDDDDNVLNAEAFVMALGSYSPLLARSTGLSLPVYPVKGYSVTVEVGKTANAPSVSLSDAERKISMSRLGENLRAAGTAEIAGYDLSLTEARCQNVLRSVTDFFPKISNSSQPLYWTGLRPMTPDGPPVLGGTSYRNLFMNTGHGTLGWTMAAGSGKITADLVSGRQPEISLDGLTLERYE